MNKFKKNKTACFLILLALVFMVIGVWRQEVETMFQKSINICLECIGIG